MQKRHTDSKAVSLYQQAAHELNGGYAREKVIDNSAERLVNHRLYRHMSDRFELVVDDELRA